MTRYPDLICLGAQKSATTWLYQVLKGRKDVFVPRIKELHYFSQIHPSEGRNIGPKHREQKVKKALEFLDSKEGGKNQDATRAILKHIAIPEIDDAWYAKVFETAQPGQKCVDVCPSYMTLPEEGIAHVLRLMPDTPLLLMVRDPVDRAWSHIRMDITRGMPDERKKPLLAGKGQLGVFAINTDYAGSITRWEAQTKPDQLKIILHDQVSADPQSVIAEVLTMMGLPVGISDASAGDTVFKGEPMEFPQVLRARLLEAFAPQYEFLKARYPDAVAGWLKKHEKALAA